MMDRAKLMSLLFFVSALVAGIAAASSVDQAQESAPVFNDWGDGTGQTFVPAVEGSLIGIDLFVKKTTHPGTIEVYLWKTTESGHPIEPCLATGVLDKADIVTPTNAWYGILFDQPYQQAPGERLAFTKHLVTSGSDGWNEYGYANSATAYTNGFMIIYNPEWHPGTFDAYPSRDLAFKTRISPLPAVFLNITPTDDGGFVLSTSTSRTNETYVLQEHKEFLAGYEWWNWRDTKNGTGASLSWIVPPQDVWGQRFYRIKIQPK